MGLPAVVIVGCFVFVAAFADFISAVQSERAEPDGGEPVVQRGASGSAPINLGRDTASRLIKGAQTTLLGVTTILLIAASVGLTIGTISGYFGGWVDEILMRIIDFGLSVPSLVVALAIVGVFGPTYWNMIFALAIAWVPIYARLTRSVVASAVRQPHIESLWVLGASRMQDHRSVISSRSLSGRC